MLVEQMPLRAEANRNGQSSWSSEASRSIIRSRHSSTTSAGRASGRSILLMHTIARCPSSSALRSTKRVCGIGPSKASTSRITPSTILSTRSTSPPKSAWPGVSMMLMCTSPYWTPVFLARIVMPRSRSMSPESITRSATCWFSRNTPDCLSIWSTSVVLPWSTCAMMAMFRMSSLLIFMRAPSSRCRKRLQIPGPSPPRA